jgi:uncharacterized membrane protein (UPF0127 family)
LGPQTYLTRMVPGVRQKPSVRVKHRVMHVGEPAAASAAVPGIEVAATYGTRLRGMLARRELPTGLLFVPGGSVHGMGMTRSLDVALLVPLEGAERVTGPYRVARTAVLRPFGLVTSRRGVRAVLEAPVGSLAAWGVVEGATVSFASPAEAAAPQQAGQ